MRFKYIAQRRLSRWSSSRKRRIARRPRSTAVPYVAAAPRPSLRLSLPASLPPARCRPRKFRWGSMESQSEIREVSREILHRLGCPAATSSLDEGQDRPAALSPRPSLDLRSSSRSEEAGPGKEEGRCSGPPETRPRPRARDHYSRSGSGAVGGEGRGLAAAVEDGGCRGSESDLDGLHPSGLVGWWSPLPDSGPDHLPILRKWPP